jgi:hypothetical protein
MIRTPEETAILVAILLKRSLKKRARVSEKTLRRLSKRTHLRHAFLDMLEEYLDMVGITMVQLDRGGYALLPSSALNGAPAITAKRYLENDLRLLNRDARYIVKLRDEANEGTYEDEDES